MWRSGLVESSRTAVRLGVYAVTVACLAPFAASFAPQLSVPEHFAVQALGASGILVLLALILRMRLSATIAAILVVWNLVAVWPFLVLPGRAQAAHDLSSLKVVSFNVWFLSSDYAAALDYLEGSGADVIGLVEVTPDWKTALQPLDRLYPYRTDCVGIVPNCEVMLLSKFPFQESYAGLTLGEMPSIAWGKIEWQGKSITLAETHLTWPLASARPRELATLTLQSRPSLPNTPRLAQAEQAANLAEYLVTLDPDLVVMGDFNGAPWSRVQSAFRKATGLHNEGGLALTWPAWGPAAIRLPLDQIFTRGDLTTVNFAAGPEVGSDHLPVEATIVTAQ